MHCLLITIIIVTAGIIIIWSQAFGSKWRKWCSKPWKIFSSWLVFYFRLCLIVIIIISFSLDQPYVIIMWESDTFCVIYVYIQDGLVCAFDLATLQEEDALLAVKNSNASVVRQQCSSCLVIGIKVCPLLLG